MTYPEKVKHLEEEIDRLEKEAEILRMQLVACSIISMSNTKTSFVFNQLPLDSPYRCASYENCENSVLREIDLLERNAELLAALEKVIEVCGANMTGQLREQALVGVPALPSKPKPPENIRYRDYSEKDVK